MDNVCNRCLFSIPSLTFSGKNRRHTKYLAGINERKGLGKVQNRYSNLKRDTRDVMIEWEGFLQKLGSSPRNVEMNPGLPD